MKRIFEILYRATPEGKLETVQVTASNVAEARVRVERTGVCVLDVALVRVAIAENQTYFRREEAFEYLRCKSSVFNELMADGVLPRALNARGGNAPLFHQRQLDGVALRHMSVIGDCGSGIADFERKVGLAA